MTRIARINAEKRLNPFYSASCIRFNVTLSASFREIQRMSTAGRYQGAIKPEPATACKRVTYITLCGTGIALNYVNLLFMYRLPKILAVAAIGFFCFEGSPPQTGNALDEVKLRVVENKAFKRGEILKYRVHYGWIDAGEAIIQVTEEKHTIEGRSAFHVIGIGYSKGSFDWFFKVRDKFESYIDEEALVPWKFIRRCNEGGYIINQDYKFDHYKKTVDANGVEYKTPDHVQDMISSFYFARNFDFSNAKKGDVFTIPSFVDKEIFDLKIKFVGRETIRTEKGKIKCLRFHPVVQKGRIFKSEDDLNVWISDDVNHIPIRAEAKILVGAIKMDLIGYANTAVPLAFIK
jgi:hypothetical protein